MAQYERLTSREDPWIPLCAKPVMMMDEAYTYHPGRFDYLKKEPFFSEMWSFLSAPEQVAAMTAATDENLPAIDPLLERIEERWGEFFASAGFPEDDVVILCNNMIKQIMEQRGYRHVACGLCHRARYIKLSGTYQKSPGSPDC